jgi:hypothetical protein
MNSKKIEKQSADNLCELWDNGFDNNRLDPGDVFDKTITYCYELERRVKALESEIAATPVLPDITDAMIGNEVHNRFFAFPKKRREIYQGIFKEACYWLRDQIKATPQVTEWINVNEKMPKDGQKVLCIQDPSKTATRDPLFGIYSEYDKRFIDPEFTPDGIHKGIAFWIEVTHWMPLPKAPTKLV